MEVIMENQEKNRVMSFIRKFKISKQHLQGALGMSLIIAIVLSGLALTPGVNLFGTMYREYEGAEEIPLSAFPATIEARADFTEETFTLYGFPEGELAGITPEHIYLGEYFRGLSVANLEAVGDTNGLRVTIAYVPPVVTDDHDTQALWQSDGARFTDNAGLISFAPEAFTDKSYYYLANVGVTYPALTCDTRFIEFLPFERISQRVNMMLIDDSFKAAPSERDIMVAGGIDNVSINNISLNGQNLAFTFTGVLDDSFTGLALTIDGGVLEKGLSVSTFIQKGAEPLAVQSSALFVTNHYSHTLDIHLQNDTWSDNFDISMLTFGGVMSGITVSGMEITGEQTITLTLTGNVIEGMGTVRFDAGAFATGRMPLIAEIKAEVPQVLIGEVLILSRQNPVVSFMVNFLNEERPDLEFELGGALSGLRISSWEWDFGIITLFLEGRLQDGNASIQTSGLFNANVGFEVITVTPFDGEEELKDGDTDQGEDGDVIIDEDEGNQGGETVQNEYESNADHAINQMSLIPANHAVKPMPLILTDVRPQNLLAGPGMNFTVTPMSLDLNPVDLLKSAASGAASGAVTTLLPYALDALGFPDSVTVELRNINTRLGEINVKLDEISGELSGMQSAMIRGFNNANYITSYSNILSNAVNMRRSFMAYASLLYEDESSDQLNLIHGSLNLNENAVKTNAAIFIDRVNHVREAIDPGTLARPNNNSLTRLYLTHLMTDTPFKHNTADLMDAYILHWTSELLCASAMMKAIYEYNATLYPTVAAYYRRLWGDEEAIINTALANLRNVIPADCIAAQNRLERGNMSLLSYDYTDKGEKISVIGNKYKNGKWDKHNVKYKQTANKASTLTVSLNKNGAVYLFANTEGLDLRHHTKHTYSGVLYWYYTNIHVFKALGYSDGSKTQTYHLPHAPDWNKARKIAYLGGGGYSEFEEKDAPQHRGLGEFFDGANSIYTIYGTGLTFNEFMSKYTSGRWWNPQLLYLGYEHKPSRDSCWTTRKSYDAAFYDKGKFLRTDHRGFVCVDYDADTGELANKPSIVGVVPLVDERGNPTELSAYVN